jgi:protein TonB
MKKMITLLMLFCTLTTFSQTVKQQNDTLVYDVTGLDVKPEFPGGVAQLNALVNDRYLQAGFAAEVKGKVYAVFIIEKDGSLSDVKILRKVDVAKAAALTRILETVPKWNPGKQNGTIVRVRYALLMVIGS